MALKGLRVIEMYGLAPVPFAGMILADFGADVIRVDRVDNPIPVNSLARGKRSISVNLKKTEGQQVVRKLCSRADVLIEPFRPGVMEKLNLGPDILLKENPRLVYARLTGFGQTGYYANRAGHDINYISIAGVLSTIGRVGERPLAPMNYLADFGGGGMTCALGILIALIERMKSGKGQVIDANMVEGSAYLASMTFQRRGTFGFDKPTGENLLDTGAPFYETYETKDGKYVALGSLEPQFYQALTDGLGIDTPQFSDLKQLKKQLTEIFLTKTRDEWCKIFDSQDACVTPVLTMQEAAQHPHNKERGAFITGTNGYPDPIAAPRLMRTPGLQETKPDPGSGEHTHDILREEGYSLEEIKTLEKSGAVEQQQMTSKL